MVVARSRVLLLKVWSVVGGLIKPYLPNIKQWFGGVVVAALAWGAFLVSPIKDLIFDTLYPENLSVVVQSDMAVSEGATFELPIVVQARGFRGISDGVLKAEVKNVGGSDVIVVNERVIDVKKTNDATVKVTLTGTAKKAGNATINLEFSNQKSAAGVNHAAHVDVVVGQSDGVIDSNFSGSWNIKLLDNLGEMVISDKKGKIGGQVSVFVTQSRNDEYLVTAKRDGNSFFGTLWPSGQPDKRVLIKAQWAPVNTSMTVVGSCIWQSFVDGGWQNDKSVDDECFEADAPIRQVS